MNEILNKLNAKLFGFCTIIDDEIHLTSSKDIFTKYNKNEKYFIHSFNSNFHKSSSNTPYIAIEGTKEELIEIFISRNKDSLILYIQSLIDKNNASIRRSLIAIENAEENIFNLGNKNSSLKALIDG